MLILVKVGMRAYTCFAVRTEAQAHALMLRFEDMEEPCSYSAASRSESQGASTREHPCLAVRTDAQAHSRAFRVEERTRIRARTSTAWF